MSAQPPRFLIIGAGCRGCDFAEAITKATDGIVAAVAEPIKSKRDALGRRYIWGRNDQPSEGEAFCDWQDFVEYETCRQKREANGDSVPAGVDGVFVCVLDEMHKQVLVALGPLGLHIMCEKPLAPSLDDCVAIYKALLPLSASNVLSVGHVLRYSPHNVMLRKLLIEDCAIGNVSSAVHTEPVGWWHFAHSYVRGNWRRHDRTGPSLLTKSCHDIDILLWILCSPKKAGHGIPHHPTSIASSGGLQFFKKSRKPPAAGGATNCMSCPLGDNGCMYSAKNIYLGKKHAGLGSGNIGWPVNILVNDIEDMASEKERTAALERALREDYDAATTSDADVSMRNWFGRCVFECDNDVCDDQFVTISWPDTPSFPAKLATFHMVPHTTEICERYSHFYGEHGEIHSDSRCITVKNFVTSEVRHFYPPLEESFHGGGDMGLARQFVLACDKVKNHGWEAEAAQNEFINCTLEEAIRSHALVFAAEEARLGQKVTVWAEFWDREVTQKLAEMDFLAS